MKLKKMFTLILVCCLLFSAASTTTMAMELNTDVTQDKTSQSILRSKDNEFLDDSSDSSSKEFTITKNTSYFIYNSGPFGTTNPVFVKFTNTNTGASCTHPIYGSTINRKINCNLTDGTYTASFLNDEDAVGYLHIVFYN